MTINEALGWKKTVANRHAELIRLRDQNSSVQRQRYGTAEIIETAPVYDAVKLDKRITLLARELRLIDTAIKAANAITAIPNYQHDEAVLGELE